MVTGVALATWVELAAASKTVSQRRFTVAASVGRISVRHILFHGAVSDERWSVVVGSAFAGSRPVMDPENVPVFTSKRCNPGPGAVTSTGFAGKWKARY